MNKPTIDIITLGCSKNLVDSEMLMGLFKSHGYYVTHDAEELHGDIAVVNTCGFIEDAKQESIDTILELVQAKNRGRLSRLYVMGCLSERYLSDLEAEIPEVDAWYGKFNYKDLLKELETHPLAPSSQEMNCHSVKVTAPQPLGREWERGLTTPGHYAYLKISEGCNRHCAYCAIPLITGRHQSRQMQEILDEVRWLVSQGVKEFQVIAQELTYYGIDIDGKQHIAELIEQMADIEGVEWIRLHYAYPAFFPWDLLRVMRENKNVCNYLDIALQHISDHMLSRMKRHVTKEETYELIRRMRREVPGIHIRTTLMVGFPGETEEDFQELIEFTKWARFERMGAFSYSEEDGTYSALNYQDDVPSEVKQRRLDKLMRIQQQISAELEAEKIGQVMRVIIDRKEGAFFIGRTEFCSPEVDPEVLIPASERLCVGMFYNVRITDAEEFDLYATTKI